MNKEDISEAIRGVIDRHTIKNIDGEDYVACDPDMLKRELIGELCRRM